MATSRNSNKTSLPTETNMHTCTGKLDEKITQLENGLLEVFIFQITHFGWHQFENLRPFGVFSSHNMSCINNTIKSSLKVVIKPKITKFY